MLHAGDYPAGSTVPVEIPFNTSGADGASITIGTNGVVAIYKDGSTTERTSASGVTFAEDHDGDTGTHLIRIDISDNADAGFYAAGSSYKVKYKTATIDGKAINAWVGMFTIERTAALMPSVAGRKLAVSAGGVGDANMTQLNASTTAASDLALMGIAYVVQGYLSADVVSAAGVPWSQTGLAAARTGMLASATASTATLDSGAPSTTQLYRGGWLKITGGTGAGQGRYISGYAARTCSVVPDWTVTPDATSTYAVGGRGGVDVESWKAGVVPATVGTGVPLVDVSLWGGVGAPAFVAGRLPSDMQSILGTGLTESVAGRLAGSQSKFGDVASPQFTAASAIQTGDSFVRIGTSGTGLTQVGLAANAVSAAALAADAITEIADGIFDQPDAIEPGLTFRKWSRAVGAGTAGDVTDGGTKYRGIGVSTIRLTVAEPVAGERTVTPNL